LWKRRRSSASSISRKARRGPEIGSGGADGFRGIGLCAFGAVDGQLGGASFATQLKRDVTVADRIGGDVRRKGVQDYAWALRTRLFRGQSEGALAHGLLKTAARKHAVHQAPLHRALPFDAFGQGREDVRQVAPHLPLVHHARQATSPWQHRQQRNLGKADRARGIIDQQDLVAGQRKLVAAPRGRSVERCQKLRPLVGRGVLHGEPRLVRELAEVHFEGMAALRQHVDVGARAKDAVQPAGDNDGAHFGMLEAQARHGVREFDIYAQVVRIEFKRVARDYGRFFGYGQRERSQRGIDGEAPVAVCRRICFEREPSGAAWPHIPSLYGGGQLA
jgi:hypothetical protein